MNNESNYTKTIQFFFLYVNSNKSRHIIEWQSVRPTGGRDGAEQLAVIGLDKSTADTSLVPQVNLD